MVDSDIATDAIVQGLEKNRAYERKDLRDFLASIIDGRVWEQLKMLSDNKEEYEPYLILEGQGFYDFSVKKWLSLKQYFETHPERKIPFYETLVAFRAFGVGLVITVDKTDTALFLSYENAKLGKPKEKKAYPLRAGFRRDWDTAKKKEYLMEAFGLKVGRALIKHYKTMVDFIMTYSPDLVPGFTKEEIIKDIADVKLDSGRRIGKVKAEEVYEVLYT